MQAMGTLMQQKNVGSISVTDITKMADLNRATFYAHFTDKQALLEACVRNCFLGHLGGFISPAAPFDRAQLRGLVAGVSEFLRQWNKGCGRVVHCELHPLVESTVQAELYDFLMDWLPRVLPRLVNSPAALDPIATLVSWATFGAAKRVSDSNPEMAEKLTDELLTFMSEGIFATREPSLALRR